MMELLQKQFRTSEPPQKNWKVNDFCAARRKKDNMWYRARISEMLEDTLKVLGPVFLQIQRGGEGSLVVKVFTHHTKTRVQFPT